jgi:predicted phosphodiesterase
VKKIEGPSYIRFVLVLACLQSVSYGQNESSNRERGARGQNSGSRLGNYEKPPPANDIPAHLYDIVLGRPTDTSIEVRILQNANGKGTIRYREENSDDVKQSEVVEFTSGKPFGIQLEKLKPNTRYLYRWCFANEAKQKETTSDEYTFHTARASGSSFAFSVTADSHLDENSSGAVYSRTLLNALADRPDFHFELGDTFMTGKYVRPELSYPQYLAQRYYMSQLCSSAPLFFVLGNHDGESAGRGSIAWAATTRKSLFANPSPNRFYTGNTQKEPEVGLPENYYGWMWGDAQFLVLDPYRYTTSKRRGGRGQRGPANAAGNAISGANEDTASTNGANWYWTLGEEQYEWLKLELRKPAKYRFVFIHHLVGGTVQNQRGGVEVANLWEWGGKSLDGKYEFNTYRQGWGKPIHQMFVDAGVSVVFHGHDHFFAKQELDGIIYQEVPQPSHARVGSTRSAAEYGYLMGDFQPSSGYVRVRVEPEAARIDYVRTYVGKQDANRNGEVSYSYVVSPRSSPR